jgi:hypothetical protein
MPITNITQVNVVANPARNLIFFEDVELCYNYQTRQWTELPAYDGIGFFSTNSQSRDIGLVRFSAGSVDLQEQLNTYPKQTGTLETAATDLNRGGRAVVNQVRPLVNGGTVAVRIGVQDALEDSVTYATGTAVNSRTGMSGLRDGSNTPEGRYQRLELVITGDWETALGADVDFAEQGSV